ncbi:unnamed protein product [Ambrosiozyma monospora]|uniref:Unnamed protein product n=1 Tax=Ambrosiozyma monospora TaxID=43982 RepID=A0A9W6T4H8_AMBMO|nr:unnamed protein product [Ambrosiozyma monospora]
MRSMHLYAPNGDMNLVSVNGAMAAGARLEFVVNKIHENKMNYVIAKIKGPRFVQTGFEAGCFLGSPTIWFKHW